MAMYRSADCQINWLWFQEKKCKIEFQDSNHGGHLETLMRMALIFDFPSEKFYLVTPMLPTKVHVIWPFSSKGVKNRFSR